MAKPSTPDLPGLGRFARSGDRRPPPAFVGRRDILDAVKADLEDELDDWRKGVSGAFAGATWLLQGAPGAGKTALLTHLAGAVAKDLGARGINWDAEDLSDADGCRRCLAYALMSGKGDAMLVIEFRETRLGGKTPIADFFRTRGRSSPALTWSGFVD